MSVLFHHRASFGDLKQSNQLPLCLSIALWNCPNTLKLPETAKFDKISTADAGITRPVFHFKQHAREEVVLRKSITAVMVNSMGSNSGLPQWRTPFWLHIS